VISWFKLNIMAGFYSRLSPMVHVAVNFRKIQSSFELRYWSESKTGFFNRSPRLRRELSYQPGEDRAASAIAFGGSFSIDRNLLYSGRADSAPKHLLIC
jgi:hypothetical protein